MIAPADHWKPAACAGCGAPWPSWSLTGPTGPWRCHTCHTAAVPVVAAELQPPPAAAPAEGYLL